MAGIPGERTHIEDHSEGSGGQSGSGFITSAHMPLATTWLVNLMPHLDLGGQRKQVYTVAEEDKSLKGRYKIVHKNGPGQGLPQPLTRRDQDKA